MEEIQILYQSAKSIPMASRPTPVIHLSLGIQTGFQRQHIGYRGFILSSVYPFPFRYWGVRVTPEVILWFTNLSVTVLSFLGAGDSNPIC